MATPYSSWLQAWGVDSSLDINTGAQSQDATAFNGAQNINAGDFTAAAQQNAGDVELPSMYHPVGEEPAPGAEKYHPIAEDGGQNDFKPSTPAEPAPEAPVGYTPIPGIDASTDVNTGVQDQNVTAFNGAGNVNAGDFTVAASQNVGDVEMPSTGSLIDGSTDINTGIQTQNVTAFNGAGNVNAGNFTVVAEQNVGDTEVPAFDDMAV